ncbi:MAG: hypothetical protein CVT94_11340 [Bacteroidetes bacterium HGW-Bacteroidetes-11]|nr:MAG: hypothetical protein CVT94_11340 [Bacteroidetes bacterium HGW-Bacteroidetes-11]
MCVIRDVKPTFERLVGEKCNHIEEHVMNLPLFKDGASLGYSQFNEVLLLLGYNRVAEFFFQFLVEQEIKEEKRIFAFKSKDELEKGINYFIQFALLWYGNIRFAFKNLSTDYDKLSELIELTKPFDETKYTNRHNQINEIINIPPEKTYLLGYIIENKLKESIRNNPNDEKSQGLLSERQRWVEQGKNNQLTYLTSDHLDVYVATSMRLEHEYLLISNLVTHIFHSEILKPLKIRWFDPTQAYCESRIDKGLSEALMLKRAKLTLYLVQESDTFGKDSELASTLAQGKPVIAFVPEGDKEYVDSLLEELRRLNPSDSEQEIILKQLKIFNPNLAWETENQKLRDWIKNSEMAEVEELKSLLYIAVEETYTKRAKTLKETHPLGIQVCLNTGVANGVLVVRSIKDCTRLIEAIILNKMSFTIGKVSEPNEEYFTLVEEISQSIFRVKTGDEILTNSFWNFYL